MNKSVVIAVVIAVLAFFWIFSGFWGPSESKNNNVGSIPPTQTQLSEAGVAQVRVRDLTAQRMEDTIEVTGRTRASRKVFLSAETDGQIAKINVEKGTVVKQGQILAQLDVQDRSAQVRDAEQLLNQREIQYNAAKELAEKGFNSRVRLAEARAQLESARANLKKARVELSNIYIKAPFDGVINNQFIEIGDYVSKGNDIFDIVDLNPVEIAGYLTEKQMEHVTEGIQTDVILLRGEKVQGVITFIAPVADSETRTFEMEMTLDNPDYSIKEGLTAKILIPIEEEHAYKVSPSILSLADDGTVGVKVVNDNNQVEFLPVHLLKDTPDYLWVGGLPEKIRLITVGQEFVISGQTVEAIPAEGQSLL